MRQRSRPPARSQSDSRSERIRARAFEHARRDPAAALGRLVQQQLEVATAVGREHIDVSVAVDIAERDETCRSYSSRTLDALRGDALEASIFSLQLYKVILGVGLALVGERLLENHMAVAHVQVEVPVVLEVREAAAEAGVPEGRGREARGRSAIDEPVAAPAEQHVPLPAQVRDEQVEVAVLLVVEGLHAHSRLSLSAARERAAERERTITEAAVRALDPQLIRQHVVRDEEIGAAIAIEVRGRHAQAVAEGGAQPRGDADVLEASCTEVAIQRVARRSAVVVRVAVVATARAEMALEFPLRRPADVVR